MLLRCLSVLWVGLPARALACAVCGQSGDQNQGSYLFMTGIMSALPLMLMGGVALWVRHHVRKSQQAAEESTPLAPAPLPVDPVSALRAKA